MDILCIYLSVVAIYVWLDIVDMSWLTGKEIEKQVDIRRIFIEPFNQSQINPNSYDYRLSPEIKVLLTNNVIDGVGCVDPKKEMRFRELIIGKKGKVLLPGWGYLASTIEKFGSDHFASLCTGKSSVGRLFLQNHACAGLIDQGFFGHITLEITVTLPVIVYPRMRIGQIFWFESIGDALLYSGKYMNQNQPLPSQIYKDIEK